MNRQEIGRHLKLSLYRYRRKLNGTTQGHIDAGHVLEEAVEEVLKNIHIKKDWRCLTKNEFGKLERYDKVRGRSGHVRSIVSVTKHRGKTTFITLRRLGRGRFVRDTVVYVSTDRAMFQKVT